MTKVNVGVIIGRFQIPKLHEGHRMLIEEVMSKSDKTIIVLGISELANSLTDPLDFKMREEMIRADFPTAIITYIKDEFDDHVWSIKLDTIINDICLPNDNVIMYGSRDSFIACYHGKFATEELPSKIKVSATEQREKAIKSMIYTSDFRAGVIWSTGNRFISPIPTVDIIVFGDKGAVLCVMNKKRKTWRFPGGFSSTNSPSYEHDVKYIIEKKLHIITTEPSYVGSCFVNDYRYRKEPQKIKTSIFTVVHKMGTLAPDDNIEEAKYFSIDKIKDLIDVEHLPIYNKLIKYLEEKNGTISTN